MAPHGPLPNSFNRTLTDFQRRLSEQQIEDFQFASLQSLREAIQSIQHEQAQRQGLRNLAKIQPFIEGLTQYSKTIEIFVNMQPLVGAIWGPIKFCLQIASKMNEAFDALLEAYEMIGAALPIVQIVDKLFYSHAHVQQVLANVFEDILTFHKRAIVFFSHRTWKLTFRLAFDTFREMFGDVLKNLERSRGLLLQSASVAHFQEAQDARILFTQEFQSRQNRDTQERMLAVVDWLAAEQSSSLQHIELQRRRADFPLTAQWPFGIGAMRSWMRRNDVSSLIFWLCGIPGAGKTVLFSSVVDKIKDCFRDAQVAYFYCKCSDNTRRTFDAISRSLIAQLLKQNPTCLEYLYEKMVASGERRPSTPKLFQEILEEICLNHDLLFICLDGLDECEVHERNLILSLIGTITKTSKAEQSVRVFITSRKEKDIERSLSSAIRLNIKAQHVESDILSYIQTQASKLQQQFDFTPEKERAVVTEIASRPQGMFLLARLIMDNLLAQENIEDLEDEMDSEVLPSGIEQAYDRILTRLCKNRPEKARQRAIFILEIITSATRTLQNHEIQGALSIRVNDQTIDVDRRKSRIPLDELCGPIVEVHLNGVIDLIHPTAKNYLLQHHSNYFLNLDRANFIMAKLCVNYLTFPCFDPTISDLNIQQYAKRGEYSFQEYATCNWIHHLKLSIDFLTKKESEQEVAAFKSAYDELQKCHVQHSRWRSIQPATETFNDEQDELKRNLGALRRLYDVESIFPEAQDKKHPCHLLGHVGRARAAIEICSAELYPENQELFLSAYGAAVYKCPILSCSRFETGFKTGASRDAHYTRHARAFKCETEDCDYSAMGFSTKAALARHIRLCHDNLTYEPTFPKISRCPIDQALNDAIRKEDLLAVRTLANEISDLPDFSTGFLMNSIIAGSRKAALIIMEILGDTKEMDHHGASGDTALHLLVEAEDEELLSVLLYTAVNINAMNQRCYTPLHVATSRGSVPIVKLLSEHPKTHLASYKATTSRVSILHLAVKSGKEEVLRFLLETSKEIFTDCNDIGDALITATKESRRDLASTLLLWGRKLNIENKYPKPYNSWILPEVDEMLPIFMGNITFEQALEKKWNATREAVVQGDVDKVEQLLTTISDINYFSNDSKTTLLATAALGSNIDMVQLLLSRGAQIVTNGTRGNNALENAAGGGHEQVMRLLLENGANVNEEPGLYSTGTALQCAAANGHLPIVQLLLELSADIEAYRGSSQNWEPTLIRAANSTSEPTAILLLKHGANRQARSLSGETALHIAAKLGKNNLLTHLLESGTNPNEHTSAGETALHIAATYGHHDLIPHLSQYGASIDATSHKTDGELETALHLAAKNGHEEFVSRLIKTGASVHSRTSVGNTALIYAASNGHSNVVELLLRGGANVDAADERGRTALGRANANNRSNTIEVLSSFGASLLYDPLRDTAVMAGNSLPLSEDDLLFTAWLRGWTN